MWGTHFIKILLKLPVKRSEVETQQTKYILKTTASKMNKENRIHDNVLHKLCLTQEIFMECDTTSVFWPGYIQQLNIRPFSACLYTEKSLNFSCSFTKEKSCICVSGSNWQSGIKGPWSIKASFILCPSIAKPG